MAGRLQFPNMPDLEEALRAHLERPTPETAAALKAAVDLEATRILMNILLSRAIDRALENLARRG